VATKKRVSGADEQALETKTFSLAHSISLLKPINNSLYGASGEIEALVTLLQNAKTITDSRRTAETLAVVCDHLVKTSTLLKSIVLSIQEGLQEKIEEPLKH